MNLHFYRYGKPKTTHLNPFVEFKYTIAKRVEEIKLQPLPPLVKVTMMMSLCGEMNAHAASIPIRKRHPFEDKPDIQFVLKNGELIKDVNHVSNQDNPRKTFVDNKR